MLRRDFFMHLAGLGLSGAAPLKAVAGMLGIAEDCRQQPPVAASPSDFPASALLHDVRLIGLGGAGRNFIDTHCRGFGWRLIAAERSYAFFPKEVYNDGLANERIVLNRCEIDIVLDSIPQGYRRDADWTDTQHDAAKIHLALQGADAVIVVAGLGRRTGNHMGPIAAGTARRLGAFTIGIGITPFEFEGPGIFRRGQEALAVLRRNADVTIEISNDRQCEILGPDCDAEDCFMHGEGPVAEFLASNFSCSGRSSGADVACSSPHDPA